MAPTARRKFPALLLAAHLLLAVLSAGRAVAAAVASEGRTDNWAVIVSSSRYWLNYRHSANALGLYQAVRRLGIPDSHIILMLADQPACSPRNVHSGQLYLTPGGGGTGGDSTSSGTSSSNLQGGDVEVDYRGREVSVDSLLRVLTGRHAPGTPASKRLRSGPASNVLLYMTGHGGDEFLKFHDQEELLATDIAAAVHQMHAGGRYGQLLLVADTCQASTLYSRIKAPNVLAVASSKLGQSSYAHHVDTTIGQHVVDQFTFYLHQFVMLLPPAQQQQQEHPAAAPGSSFSSSAGAGAAASAAPSMQQLLDYISGQRLSSDVQVRTDLFPRRLAEVPVTDFFGAAAAVTGAAAEAAAEDASSSDDGGCGSCSASGSGTAQALLLLTKQQRGERRAPAAAAGGTLPQRPPQQQQDQQQQQPPYLQLFQLLEAAGGRSSSSSKPSPQWRPSGLGTEAAAVAAAWTAAVLLTRWLHKA